MAFAKKAELEWDLIKPKDDDDDDDEEEEEEWATASWLLAQV